jgi:prophage maintenance system killer protein
MNGVIVEADEDELSAFVLAVVAGRHDKPAIASYLRRHAVT